MRCLALDIGSSSIKGAVLELSERKLGQATSRPFPAPLRGLPGGYFEVPPAGIEETVRQVVGSLLEVAPDAESLYVAGQMGGLVLVDDDGRPLTNYLSWRDQRTLAEEPDFLDRLRGRLGEDVFQCLGRELQAGSTMALLCWLAERGRPIDGGIPLTLGDYLLGRLGGMTSQMHVTQALGMLDLARGDWHREALDRLGLEQVRLPQLARGVDFRGRLRIAGRELRLYGAFGDQQCALEGAGLAPDELSINISTGSQVSRRAALPTAGDFQTRAYLDGKLLQTITHLPAGRSLNVLVDLLSELAKAEGVTLEDPWGSIERLVAGVNPDRATSADDLEVDLAFYAGPLGSTGSLRGLTTENLTVGRLFDAAFRAMADNFARCARRLDPQASWSAVVLSGTLASSAPRLRHWIEQRFGVPLRVAGQEETLLGLLELAARHERAG